MKSNIGTTDKIIRMTIALIIAILAYTELINGILATILLVVAAVLVLTSLISFCGLYKIFGCSTCKTKK